MPSSSAALPLLLSICFTGTEPGPAVTMLKPLEAGVENAGCNIWIEDEARTIMTVEFRSIEMGNAGAARARIGNMVRPLDWVEQSPKRWVFRGEDLTIELDGMTEIEPICGGSECEGSRYRAVLSVDHDGERVRYDVVAHCGS